VNTSVAGWLRLDVVKLLLLAIPVFAFKQLLLGVDLKARGAGVALGLLVIAAAAVLWRRRRRPVALGNGFLTFFLAYCLLFALAAESDLLSGQRVLLAGYEETLPRNFLAPNGLGDWHYAWAPAAPTAQDLIVVTLATAGELREDARRRFAFLIRKALEHEARGIAFDFYLEQPSEVDAFLAAELARADEAGMPVLFGYRHEAKEDGWIVRRPLPPELAPALPLARLGHLAGYLEHDGKVRMTPVGLPGVGGLESLSFKIAATLSGEVTAPESGLVQFTAPRGGVRVEEFSPELDWELWRDRFVIVGPPGRSDARQTPFGELQGVVIHAYAAHSLRTGCYITRLDSDWAFPAIFVFGYVLTVLEARGSPRRALAATALGMSLAVAVTAALAVHVAWLWIDVSYPLAAIWGLTGLLLAGRWLRGRWTTGRRQRPVEIPATPVPLPEGDGFDVFLSHNGRDKPQVRGISGALAARGLRPWLDEQQLAPGRPWQEVLEEVIRTVRSSAVTVGADGLGPWEVPEMRASLSECVRRGLPVIPVLLPGAPAQPVLPIFLTQYTWVDLRRGITEEGLDRLEWGITGVKPGAGRTAGRRSRME
jgi:CHASE2 domain-containing sensor protein